MHIAGLPSFPTPNYSISKEVIRAGGVIAGGSIVVSVNGTYHASNESDFYQAINSINSLMGSCVVCTGTSGCSGDKDLKGGLDGAVGEVASVSTSPGGSALDFNYNAQVKFYKDNRKAKLIKDKLPLRVPDNILVRSYSESAGPSTSNMIAFSANPGGLLTKVAGKAQVSVSIGVDDADQCSSSDQDTKEQIKTMITGRLNSLEGSIQPPSGYAKIRVNKKINIGLTGGSGSYEIYFVAAGAIALVDFSVINSTDEITGNKTGILRGSITGIGNGSAQGVYNKIKNHVPTGGGPGGISGDCGSVSYLNLDSCYILQSSRSTEDPVNDKIDFEITYQDVEKCVFQGYKVETEYEETYSTNQYVEHNIPGQSTLVYYSSTQNAKRAKLTVKSNYYGCDESFQGTISAAVGQVYGQKLTEFGLSGMLKLSTAVYDGKYSYQKTEEFIEC